MILHKQLRVSILLVILLIVALGNWATNMRATDWSHALRVVIYPINGDHSEATEHYIQNLNEDDFKTIKLFFIEELENFGISYADPINIALSPPVRQHPPQIPLQSNIFEVMLWSLKLRYWAFQRDEYQGPKPEIQIFALYYNPETTSTIRHSTGLENGHVAIINLFAHKKQKHTNQFIITHELLHTLGATDKYDLSNNQPVYPDGYAESELDPLYPQQFAEIMGGRIPQNKEESSIPNSLYEVVIGEQTAREIHLIQ